MPAVPEEELDAARESGDTSPVMQVAIPLVSTSIKAGPESNDVVVRTASSPATPCAPRRAGVSSGTTANGRAPHLFEARAVIARTLDLRSDGRARARNHGRGRDGGRESFAPSKRTAAALAIPARKTARDRSGGYVQADPVPSTPSPMARRRRSPETVDARKYVIDLLAPIFRFPPSRQPGHPDGYEGGLVPLPDGRPVAQNGGARRAAPA